jgi:hypothetical protein
MYGITVKQWDRFAHTPWGVLAHSTHVRGSVAYEHVGSSARASR